MLYSWVWRHSVVRSLLWPTVSVRCGSVAPWSVQAWLRNATDEDYAVRGFYFGLEPPDFADRLYVQRGDGRLAGITLQWRWQ